MLGNNLLPHLRLLINQYCMNNYRQANTNHRLVKQFLNVSSFVSCRQSCMPITTSSSKRPLTVLVEGNIASGKTQFINFFKDVEGIQICDEPVNEWRNVRGSHNALALFYQDAPRWSLALQSYVQLTMLKGHIRNENKAVKVMERSIFSARYVFVENLHKSGIMIDIDYAVLDEWFEWIIANHDCSADLVIYLRTLPETCLRRIRHRGRQEELSVPLSYLQSIHDCHENWLINKSNRHWTVPNNIQVIDANANLDEMVKTYREHRDRLAEYVSSR